MCAGSSDATAMHHSMNYTRRRCCLCGCANTCPWKLYKVAYALCMSSLGYANCCVKCRRYIGFALMYTAHTHTHTHTRARARARNVKYLQECTYHHVSNGVV